MVLKLRARRPRWFEKKWKPKKPILYIIETVKGKWVNTYWWGGNYRYDRKIRFYNSGTAQTGDCYRGIDQVWLVVGRSGTTLNVTEFLTSERRKIKSLNPKDTEWTCFGKISGLGIFTEEVSGFNLEEKLREHRI